MNILKYLKGDRGNPAWIIVDENGRRTMIKGEVKTQWKDGLQVGYTWKGGQGHTFITLEGALLFEFDKLPVFGHNVGHLFGECSGLKLDEDDKRGEISSAYYDALSNCDIAERVIDSIEEWDRSGGLPWKWILIIGGAAIGIIILWKAGVIQSLLQSIGVQI